MDGGNFGTLDLVTGAYTSEGSSATTVAGLGVVGGTLYGGAYGGNTLYRINPLNGFETAIGTGSISYDDFGSTPTGGLYGLNSSGNLYSINSSTGSATIIGNLGFGIGGDSNLSNNSGTLYLVSGGDLYTVNTSTGAATRVGASSPGGMSGLLLDNGNLYGANTSLFTLNTTTGLSTSVAAITGSGAGLVFGLVTDPITSAVPEPQTYLLMAVGLALVFLSVGRRRTVKANPSSGVPAF